MLPDIPGTKRDIQAKLFRDAETEHRKRGGILPEIGVTHQHEGDSFVQGHVDLTEQEISYERFASPVCLDLTDLAASDYCSVLRIVCQARMEIADLQTKRLLEVVGQGAESVGNVVDAEGRAISADLLLEGYEKVDFDPVTGDPPTLVVNPSMRNSLEAIVNDPGFGVRFEELKKRKQWEWLGKESSRKLVD